MQINGNTILITGGTSGIGLAFAEEFVKHGNTVIITGRRQDRLDAIQQRIPGIVVKNSDMADAAQREELVNWVYTHYPETNVLINNAGVQLAMDLSKPVDPTRVYTEIDTNLVGPIHLGSLFVPHLLGQKNPVIINVTSGLAWVPAAFMPVYCATKAAMHSFTLSQRWQLRNTNIQVVEVAPPSVDTELGHDRREDKTQSHGGIPISEFIKEAMAALIDGEPEAAIGGAKDLRAKGETIFEAFNSRF
ncbi:SDR family oxidoreductase [Chitinophaga silvisoli]|uniref:SDR family NAD(P)-dependent oxidoreductase n=1 Tax=Chitinophaga silvisoli TaxID=2291814 RepID=A0A3E1NYT0_9BACT|nr:SDR family NAD(P)-dependent oxidoreductase [Chitinophaga silvisoli]RFM33107.1 SDR family NAD(P)-dependent oxidoreductase [Chitinophaga silvisoli]